MRTITVTIVLGIIASLSSCGGAGSQAANANGFSDIEKEIKSKFGENAYYTDLTIAFNESVGNIISLTVSDKPESLSMEQWNLMQGAWKQNSEITLEVPKGAKASDFMFQLNNEISLSKLGELVEESKKKLTAEKKIENPALELALIKYPKDGNKPKTEYTVMLVPEHGGTTFTFRYKLNGEFIKMSY